MESALAAGSIDPSSSCRQQQGVEEEADADGMNPIIASSSSIVIRAQGAYFTLNNIKNPKLNPPPPKKKKGKF